MSSNKEDSPARQLEAELLQAVEPSLPPLAPSRSPSPTRQLLIELSEAAEHPLPPQSQEEVQILESTAVSENIQMNQALLPGPLNGPTNMVLRLTSVPIHPDYECDAVKATLRHEAAEKDESHARYYLFGVRNDRIPHYKWRPNNMQMGGLHYHHDFFHRFPRMALRLNSIAELEEELVAIQQPGYRAALHTKFLQFHYNAYFDKTIHAEHWIRALTAISADRSVLETASQRDDQGLSIILVVDVHQGARINEYLLDTPQLVVSIQNERNWAQDYYDAPSPLLNTYKLPHLEGYAPRTHIGADKGRKTTHLSVPTGLKYYNAFFKDFPLRAIWIDSDQELDEELAKFNQDTHLNTGKKVTLLELFDEEYNQIRRSTYHLMLLSILDIYHPGVDADGSLEADKHLETWVHTLDQADLDRDRLRVYNDHGVWTGGYSIKPIGRGNISKAAEPPYWTPRVTEASISPEDLQDLRTYQLQVPNFVQDNDYRIHRAPLGGTPQVRIES